MLTRKTVRILFVWFSLLALAVAITQSATPDHLVGVASSYVGQTETHGPNRSPVIDRWNRSVGAPLGSPYCASAVSAWLDSVGAVLPLQRSASSRAFIHNANAVPVSKIIRGEYRIRKGDVIVWKRAGGGHIGVAFEDWRGLSGRVVEANTSAPRVSGSQWNGNGVWVRTRTIRPADAFRITHVVPTVFVRGRQ